MSGRTTDPLGSHEIPTTDPLQYPMQDSRSTRVRLSRTRSSQPTGRDSLNSLATENTTMSTQITNRIRRTLFAVVLPVLALLALDVTAAMGQVPTPEGTTITNIATVGWSDANTNTYTSVNASVDVTVDFAAGLDVTGPSDNSPLVGGSASAGFVLTNNGNGTDQLQVTSFTNSNELVLLAANVTYTAVDTAGVAVPGGPFASIALLNAALATIEVIPGESITVTANYDILANTGGLTTTIELTAESNRTGTVTDSDPVVLTPSLTGTITVTDSNDSEQLPNGTYTVDFKVSSTLTGNEDITVTASILGANTAQATITGISDNAGTSDTDTDITSTYAQGTFKIITVTYTLPTPPDAVAGETVEFQLTADGALSLVSATDLTPPVTTVIQPAMTITKTVSSTPDGLTAVTNVIPGQTIYYVITITNNGTAEATSVLVTDALPDEVLFVEIQSTSGVSWDATPTHDAAPFGGDVTGNIALLGKLGSGSETAGMIIEVTVR